MLGSFFSTTDYRALFYLRLVEIGPVTAALLGLPFNSRFFPSIDDNFAGAPTISFHRRFLRHRRFLHRYFSLVDSPDDIFPSVDSFADDVLPTTLLLLLSPAIITNFDWNALTDINFSFGKHIRAEYADQHLDVNDVYAQPLDWDYMARLFLNDNAVKTLKSDPITILRSIIVDAIMEELPAREKNTRWS
eukprot:jgi/Psemu1/69125/estExt_Genemark1.C_7150005